MSDPLPASALNVTPLSATTMRLALERGVLSPEQAASLIEIERAAQPLHEVEDDEKLRFVTGFGDIFVTIGLGLFLGAFSFFCMLWFGLIGTTICIVAVSWLLAEFFTRRRRMALPSIVLLLVFASSVFTASWLLYLLAFEDQAAPLLPLETVAGSDLIAFTVAGLVTVAAVTLHYWRFRIPITVAAGTVALLGALVACLVFFVPELTARYFRWITLVIGLAVFAFAMVFDMRDPRRLTRLTDIAFWLHLLAAPLIVHSLIGGFILHDEAVASPWAILGVFLLLAIIALLVDRRAILVSGLSYAGYALTDLFGSAIFLQNLIPLVALILGAFILMLSAGWHWLRAQILRLIGPNLARRLPGSHLRSS